MNKKVTEKLIIALDNVKSERSFAKTVKELKQYSGYFKVGLELISSKKGIGPYLKILKKNKVKIFYDAKLHDIPNTVSKAVKNICSLDVDILTIHVSGGEKMLKAAFEAKKESKSKMQIFGVTILTSLTDSATKTIYGKKSREKVLELALLAKQSGLDGIICSPLELTFLKSHKELRGLKFITPGIRPDWSQKDEQNRVSTPYVAIKNGADMIVIGRPITENKNPLHTAKLILKEILKAL